MAQRIRKKACLQLSEQQVYQESTHLNLEGRRIVNLDKLKKMVTLLTVHSATCNDLHIHMKSNHEGIILEAEVRRDGLVSIFRAKCSGCGKYFYFETDSKIRDANGHKRYSINLAAVWGSMATGGGGSKLEEILSTMGVPPLAQKTFSRIEHQIGEWWKDKLGEDMRKAAEEERELAIQNNELHEGVPAITVIVDGGWSSRSHKHSYNALGGVGIIIGQRTKKVLHIGVRVKYCAICSRAATMKVKPKEHKCFNNWSESSRAMESDIILEGFNEAESKFGLRYLKMIGDGDSSVLENGPHWCRDLQKIECANHCCKCIRTALENFVKDKSDFKGRNGLTKAKRVQMVSAIRYCIKMRTNEVKSGKERFQAVRDLQNDIKLMLFHIFGHHEKCSPSFCKTVKVKEVTEVQYDNFERVQDDTFNQDDAVTVSNVLNETYQFWTEGMSLG